MMSLDNIAKKLGETFDDLTKGIDIEPLLKGFKELAGIFDLSTVTGQALKSIVKVFGGDLVKTFAEGTPLARQFVEGLIIGGLRITIAYLKVRNAIRDFVGPDVLKKLADYQVGLSLVGATFDAIKAAVLASSGPVSDMLRVIGGLNDLLLLAAGRGGGDGKAIGVATTKGIEAGLAAGRPGVEKNVAGLGDAVKNAFKASLGIHSPSSVFADFGKFTAEGYERGIERGKSGAQGATDAMVAVPAPSASSASAGRAGGGAPISISVEINASGGESARAVAAAVSSDSVLEQITKAIVDGLSGAGVPVPA